MAVNALRCAAGDIAINKRSQANASAPVPAKICARRKSQGIRCPNRASGRLAVAKAAPDQNRDYAPPPLTWDKAGGPDALRLERVVRGRYLAK